MEELVYAKDVEELSEAVTVKQKKGRPLLMAELMSYAYVVPEPPPPPPRHSDGPGP
jgi:hypothetical protein